MHLRRTQIQKTLFFVFFMAVFFLPAQTHAAMLSISPGTGKYTVGQTFTATVQASSYSKSMNAVSGDLVYPSDILSVISVSKKNSIIQNWLPPNSNGPVYSIGSGTIHFEGFLLGGYKGAPKPVFSVAFKVIKSGTATLSFSKGTILANDGKGTNIIQAVGTADYQLAMGKISAPVVGQVKPENPVVPPTTSAPSVVNIPATSSPVAVASPSTEPYLTLILIGLAVLIVLVVLLFFRVMYLSRLVGDLQSRKRVSPRKKSVEVSSPRKVSKLKPNVVLVQ